ncbi:MAG: hypothetical protein KGS48_14610 [Bacteroidetes bacterium]|nr:hypothetical protein [Bacteroidota bacterium]
MKITLPRTLGALCFMLSVFTLFTACKKEEKACATYKADIKAIVDNSCSYSGCHSGSSASTYVPANAKDYTNYAGLKVSIDNGTFKNRVLVKADMPNPSFVFGDHPKSLTQAEKDKISCWLDAGAPEQ